MNSWIALITSLPTENATVRMRAWRSLKASGAAVLRDGVYLLPAREDCQLTLDSVAAEVRAANGTALVVRIEGQADEDFAVRFDRSSDYANLMAEITLACQALSPDTSSDMQRQVRKLRKAFAHLLTIDFFPTPIQKSVDSALCDLEHRIARALAPDDPYPVEDAISYLNIQDYQGRVWATRRRPWVDRLASAWLIQRFIDRNASFLWLASPEDCPLNAVGFDFDGATFSHIGSKVTFEVLLASFRLESTALNRVGSIVHFLDVGGVQPPEAIGIESVLDGLRQSKIDDDELLAMASNIFDGLLTTFKQAAKP